MLQILDLCKGFFLTFSEENCGIIFRNNSHNIHNKHGLVFNKMYFHNHNTISTRITMEMVIFCFHFQLHCIIWTGRLLLHRWKHDLSGFYVGQGSGGPGYAGGRSSGWSIFWSVWPAAVVLFWACWYRYSSCIWCNSSFLLCFAIHLQQQQQQQNSSQRMMHTTATSHTMLSLGHVCPPPR